MIELALALRAIQSSFMAYKWTMAMLFCFKYCIDPKDHKSEEEIKAIAVEGAMRPKLLVDAKQDRSTIRTLKHCSSVCG